jgi:hypothetical protein
MKEPNSRWTSFVPSSPSLGPICVSSPLHGAVDSSIVFLCSKLLYIFLSWVQLSQLVFFTGLVVWQIVLQTHCCVTALQVPYHHFPGKETWGRTELRRLMILLHSFLGMAVISSDSVNISPWNGAAAVHISITFIPVFLPVAGVLCKERSRKMVHSRYAYIL